MIDARGYSCPTPVVMVQKAVKEGAPSKLEVESESKYLHLVQIPVFLLTFS